MLLTACVVSAGCTATLATGPGSAPPPSSGPVVVRDHRHDQPPPPPDRNDHRPPPPPFVWNHQGWTLLGSATVDGAHDHDSIKVAAAGAAVTFSKVTVVVTDADLQLEDITFKFGDHSTFSPNVKHTFREGQRTRAIDLPGDKRLITNIDLRYSPLPGGGQARLEVWAKP